MSQPYKPDFAHTFTRRARHHDYFSPYIYHIILKKTSDCQPFGELCGDASFAPGQQGSAFVLRNDLGNSIADVIYHIDGIDPVLQNYQYKVMPDHVHFILRIHKRTPKHLGYYIGLLKTRIAKNYSRKIGKKILAKSIFQPNYCDKPLHPGRSLNELYTYIRENPHRLAMRLQYPNFFQRARKIQIGENYYEAYGNLFLLRNPDKESVRISRKYTPEEKSALKNNWLNHAYKEGVLVSPFISNEEKQIRKEAEELGGKIILITHEAFPERFKPSKHDFDLCSQGRLLIISLGKPKSTLLTRSLCLQMNALAETLSHQGKKA